MALVAREGAFQVRILTNDHPPPHAHVYAAEFEWRVALGGSRDEVRLLEAKPADTPGKRTREAVALVAAHRESCVLLWRKFHGV